MEVDYSVEHFATDEAKWPVDSGQCSVQESPSISLVVVAVWVGMVQVGDGNWRRG